jgi:hypothetical protein
MALSLTGARPRRATARLAAVLAAGALALAPTAALAAPLTLAADPVSESEGESGRRPVAETPRDQLGLIVLGALAAAAALGVGNARRQLRGERPKADGQFRWR